MGSFKKKRSVKMGSWKMPWHDAWNTVTQKTLIMHDQQQVGEFISQLINSSKPTVLAFVNAHAMNLAAKDRQFAQLLVRTDVLLRDGFGMAIYYRLMGIDPGLNMNGTDLIPKILSAYSHKRIALWGTNEPFLSDAASRIENGFGARIVSRAHGFFETEHYLQLLNQHRPDLVVLGMGMPKQEMVAEQLREHGPQPFLIVCGGAIIDFLGGKVERAPTFFRHIGMEWSYRLAREPKRLFRRYVVGNPVFLYRATLLKVKSYRLFRSSR